MRVELGFPYRGDELRERIFKEKVLHEVASYYPFDNVVVADSRHDPFNRAASRNEIVAVALENKADVVVICDADSIPQKNNLEQAIGNCFNDGLLHVPFDTVRVIPPRYAFLPGDNFKRASESYSYGPSCGGIYVIRPQRWVDAGGMDERILGWGYEDQIWLAAVKTFLGDYRPYPGILYNFSHPREHVEDYKAANVDLRDNYHRVLGYKDGMRQLQVGSNRWMT